MFFMQRHMCSILLSLVANLLQNSGNITFVRTQEIRTLAQNSQVLNEA